jgi:hypothetical protein
MKVLENRMRRAAERQGFILEKSRRRDKRATGFGLYRLLVNHRDLDDHRELTPFTMTLEQVRKFLEPLESDADHFE